MPQDIDQFLFTTLNQDATLRSLWGSEIPNPYALVAEQNRVFPYTVYLMLNRANKPTLDNPDGVLNKWVYSFTTFARGTRALEGRKQAKDIANRIADVLIAIQQRPGFQSCFEVARNEAWNELEKVYRYTTDFEIMENLACVP